MGVPLRVGLSVLSFAKETFTKKSYSIQQKDATAIPHANHPLKTKQSKTDHRMIKAQIL